MKFLHVLLLLAFASASPAETFRDHHAHVHGHAKMTLVLSEQTLELDLDTPAMNIVGFEHDAKSSADKAELTAAVSFLDNPANWIAVDTAANCQPDHSHVDSSLLHNHDISGEKKVRREKPDEKHGHEQHADFELMVRYHCARPGKLKSIDFSALFKRFTALEDIDVDWLTDERQAASELNSEQAIIILQ